MIKFSFIVPVHNVEAFLPECLDSMLRQSYENFEIIVIDDVSTDSSRQIAEDYARLYPQKLQLIVHQKNTRQGGARNTGIRAATGDYLLFIDSDDYIRSDTLQVLADNIHRTQADIVEFPFEFVSETGQPSGTFSFSDRLEAQNGDTSKPLLISTMGPWNRTYRSTLFSDPSLSFPENYYYEDYCLVPRLLLAANKVHYICKPLYYYRLRNASTIRTTNTERNRDIMVCTDILLQYYKEHQLSREVFLQLEYLALEHVLLHATLRVFSVDPRSHIVSELKQYVAKNFPDHASNPYKHVLSKRYRKLLRYIEKEQYFMLYLHWNLRNRITGTLKCLLNKLKK